ncbi:MAG: sulfide/dihydroorotate dehydrogenase-like FAD/NAD-binding protein [Planctomycetes bacterium]|nr:sulfide/dihydroorotate dehydrogenase-like FAD/NAD-binding protein [Planctomycetota bacterium]
MFPILAARTLAPLVKEFVIDARPVALKAKAGQFIVLRIDETGERIPLTIAGVDATQGTVRIVFLEVGKSTRKLGTLGAGDSLLDFVGPLGNPSHVEKFGTVVCIGGGVGVPAVLPIAHALKAAGNHVIGITGARRADLLILEDEMRGACHELFVTTDDGSRGDRGLVTDPLRRFIAEGRKIDLVVAVGPAIMMKAVAAATQPHGLKTVVSLNSVMVDGTGMCGGCRVTVGGQTKFVCVDGPEFDAHQVNFDELMMRQRMYRNQEKTALTRYDECRSAQPREEVTSRG